jgi:hypothetical protein
MARRRRKSGGFIRRGADVFNRSLKPKHRQVNGQKICVVTPLLVLTFDFDVDEALDELHDRRRFARGMANDQISRSFSFLPAVKAELNQRGCLPRPDQVCV